MTKRGGGYPYKAVNGFHTSVVTGIEPLDQTFWSMACHASQIGFQTSIQLIVDGRQY